MNIVTYKEITVADPSPRGGYITVQYTEDRNGRHMRAVLRDVTDEFDDDDIFDYVSDQICDPESGSHRRPAVVTKQIY